MESAKALGWSGWCGVSVGHLDVSEQRKKIAGWQWREKAGRLQAVPEKVERICIFILSEMENHCRCANGC